MNRFLRPLTALILILILTTSCATVPAPAPALEAVAVVAPDEKVIGVKKGDPAPEDGVWMSEALALKKAGNCAKWEETGKACLTELRKEPPQIKPLPFYIGVGLGVFVAGVAAGYYVAK